MSWLNERIIKYRYKLADGRIKHLELSCTEEAPLTHVFDNDLGQYDGFEKEIVEQTNVVEYDQHGRKAVRIKDKDGNIRHQSLSKLHWAKTGRIENKYTPAYEEHLRKTQQEQLLRTEHNKKRARTSTPTAAELLKDLPDGEYISDGKSVSIAPPGIVDKKKA